MALNETAIDYASSRDWITEWEKAFLIDTKRKRVLSDKHKAQGQDISNVG